MKFTKQNINIIRAEIDAALKIVAEKHGIEIHAGNASYLPDFSKVTFKLDCDAKSTSERQDEKLEKKKAHLEMFAPDLVDKRVCLQGRIFEVVGYNSRATRKPILIRCINDHKTYTCSRIAAERNIIESVS